MSSRTTEQMTLAEMQTKMFECEDSVYAQIRKLNERIEAQDISIAKAEAKRNEMNAKLDKIAKQAKENYDSFTSHTAEEMEQYKAIVRSIDNLTVELRAVVKQTQENTGYIQSVEHDNVMEKMRQAIIDEERERIAKEQAPRKEMIEKVKMTAITVVTGTVVSGIIAILWFGFKAYVMFGVGGMSE